MKPKFFLLLALAAVLVLITLAAAGCGSSTSTSTTSTTATTPGGHAVLTPEQLTDAAPGLGTVMVEVGHRNWMLYYSATGGNWDLAAYQAKELGEAIDTGEITRPARKDALEGFTKSSFDPLVAAIKAKDSAQFMTAWNNEVQACNACHVGQGFKYIQWSLPKTPPEDLTLTAVP